MAMLNQDVNYKGQLVQFLQKYTQRPLTKDDIVYTVSKFGAQCQAIVKLNALDGQEYAGHLCSDSKAAERSAADQALQANMTLVNATVGQAQKRKFALGPGQPSNGPALVPPRNAGLAVPMKVPQVPPAKKAKVDDTVPATMTPKVQLNSLVGKLSNKVPALEKGDFIYSTSQIGSEFQATVQIISLPGEWATRAWAGHLSATKMAAEQSAAEQALQDLTADPQLMEEAERKKKQAKHSNADKKWNQMWEAVQQMSDQMAQEMVRERSPVGDGFVSGKVTSWKGRYGWIVPDVPVAHEAAKQRDGKIYVYITDIAGATPLAEGQNVMFKVYVDPSGLGAEEVSIV